MDIYSAILVQMDSIHFVDKFNYFLVKIDLISSSRFIKFLTSSERWNFSFKHATKSSEGRKYILNSLYVLL